MIDPAKLDKLTKEELVEAYVNASTQEEQIVAEKVMLREEILRRLEGDGEVIGDYSVSKARRYTFTTTLAEAKLLGAVKEAIDQMTLKSLYLKGVKIPGEVKVTEYPMIKNITQKEGEE